MSEWISVQDKLPNEELDSYNRSKNCLVYIDNPFFEDGNYHVSYLEKSVFGGFHWRGIEPNVHHGTNCPNVTHWMPLPEPPKQ